MDICKKEAPKYREYTPGHCVACHLYNDKPEVTQEAAAEAANK